MLAKSFSEDNKSGWSDGSCLFCVSMTSTWIFSASSICPTLILMTARILLASSNLGSPLSMVSQSFATTWTCVFSASMEEPSACKVQAKLLMDTNVKTLSAPCDSLRCFMTCFWISADSSYRPWRCRISHKRSLASNVNSLSSPALRPNELISVFVIASASLYRPRRNASREHCSISLRTLICPTPRSAFRWSTTYFKNLSAVLRAPISSLNQENKVWVVKYFKWMISFVRGETLSSR